MRRNWLNLSSCRMKWLCIYRPAGSDDFPFLFLNGTTSLQFGDLKEQMAPVAFVQICPGHWLHIFLIWEPFLLIFYSSHMCISTMHSPLKTTQKATTSPESSSMGSYRLTSLFPCNNSPAQAAVVTSKYNSRWWLILQISKWHRI